MSRIGRVLLAVAVLPHEAAHAAVARLFGLDAEVELLPAWGGSGRPLGRFDARVPEATPTAVVRAVALAPLAYVGAAAALDAVLPAESGLRFLAIAPLAYWAALSNGDLAVAADPETVRERGRFVVADEGWSGPTADALTVLTTGAVAGLLLA
ncbi:metalloprotease family protein [Halobaculum sp. EA56]|uniref:metalloprotease family protein n=1 Tax=Halobaculum sp. EA56 TaxID=3421648 RepID=UPI003EBE7569